MSNGRNQSFFALCALLQDSGRKRVSKKRAAAAGIVDEITSIILTATNADPKLHVAKILEQCTPALVDAIERIIDK
jgi:hypothetical protein